ncbi:MAG: YopX family protein [Candidatus Babeliales bacterium]|jgi:uncharacterized phage protein (TIGR01671 family)
MREIKFRGERLYRTEAEPLLIYGQFEWDAWHHPRIVNEHGAFEVKPETLGQYTGLKDKKDKEIFEGDIIRLPAIDVSLDGKWAQGYIEDDGGCSYSFIGIKPKDFEGEEYSLSFLPSADLQVIGNIYETPEKLSQW